MRPPQAPAEEVQRRAELEVEVRAATVQEEQAEEALRVAEAAETAAKERLAAVTAGSEPSRDAELAIYQARLVEAQAVSASCEAPFERLVELHDHLHRFASEPQRDAAIAALEGCRKRARGEEAGARGGAGRAAPGLRAGGRGGVRRREPGRARAAGRDRQG
ncbi:hypothetical protein [Nannocystis pusilla]|uniref:hypothetical protein n=1 Tax=Nannocystis pusilla TaxID=889268 RepID=UPI003B7C8F1C